jgi:hypothetical protein
MKMKQTIAVLAGLMVAGSLCAQGLVNFRNAPAGAVIDGTTGSPAAAGVALAGLYYNTDLGAAPNLDVANDGWLLASTTAVVGSFGGGIYSGGNTAIPGVAGATEVLLQVRAWSEAYASYEEAFNGGGLVGGSNVMNVTLARPGTTDPVPSLASLVSGFTITPVPEPSTIVLGLLGGLGAMVLLRRRK